MTFQSLKENNHPQIWIQEMKIVDYLMIGATIRIGREILRLPYAGFFLADYSFPSNWECLGKGALNTSIKRESHLILAVPGPPIYLVHELPVPILHPPPSRPLAPEDVLVLGEERLGQAELLQP